MIQRQFAERAKEVIETDENVIGLAVAGSWLTNEMDEFSDLDLILVTQDKISNDKDKMLGYAKRLGDLLSGFTGEHVGEPRVLICLYDNPLLHVDIKFVTLEEFHIRIETPTILLDKGSRLQQALDNSRPKFPYPDYQWIEDRFWIWIHYALLKIGRGEYLEAYDFFGFLRMVVFGPLLHIKNENLPRGVRKVETSLQEDDLKRLLDTIPTYDVSGLLCGLRSAVELYRQLRQSLFGTNVLLHQQAEKKVMEYFEHIEHVKNKMADERRDG
ncbi:aminoglycoside 6-adenylyltransferase [Flavisolibacter ginsengisoli]|jgi:predicted nucleotidyltransferase|uniref:Streptomycin adenylyltransferase n=1 Tax=Flavisolibacter ginsengisoli DSM 18119 TaxID=1121884 RepID=A0A1M4XYU7_9BACT|nr:aminoglycoside 6-adenylyltransferase [Flavisolibacter ginsengisoli]SHE98615.1 Streptomycin adenylyltransferase [Flavisolibacter ginsengisoli DSM 18119]